MVQSDLSGPVKHVIEDFVRVLKDIYKDGLACVFLYGSAASNELNVKAGTINVAVILADGRLQNVARLKKVMRRYRFRSLDPIILTEDYIKRSLDVFPVEFLDMKENHIVVYGDDLPADLRVDLKNLRFQCEHELKSKLLNIKRVYLRASGTRELKEALFKSLTSSLHILRNLIRLKGKTPPYVKADILNSLETEFGMDTAVFRKILDAKLGKARLGRKEIESLFFAFADDLERAAAVVDRL